jgi:hypothetical protein
MRLNNRIPVEFCSPTSAIDLIKCQLSCRIMATFATGIANPRRRFIGLQLLLLPHGYDPKSKSS